MKFYTISMKALFLLKCLLLHVFAYVILSTMFVETPYFSIIFKYRLEEIEGIQVTDWNSLSEDSVCPHIFEDIVYVSLVLYKKLYKTYYVFSFNVKGHIPKIFKLCL